MNNDRLKINRLRKEHNKQPMIFSNFLHSDDDDVLVEQG